MDRRAFVLHLGAAALAVPVGAHAQSADRPKRIAVLMSTAENDAEGQARLGAYVDALKALGWTTGRNLVLDVRWSVIDPAQAKVVAADVVAKAPDLVLANAGQAAKGMQGATTTIPVVFVQVANPMEQGLVPNFAHPGGNVTGFTSFEDSMGSKWLQLLKETVPRLARVALLQNASQTAGTAQMKPAIEAAAPSMGVTLSTAVVRDAGEIERAYEGFARDGIGGVILIPDPLFTNTRDRLIAAAARYRIPTAYYFRYFANSGGFIAYGPHTLDIYQRAAGYTDRILKGAKPGDLPVQQPTKFELGINLATAKALGITVPQSLVQRADEVIR